MKNRVITTLMSRAALAAVAGASLTATAAPKPKRHKKRKRIKGVLMNGECNITPHSSLRKRMREARRYPVNAPPPQADKYLNSYARAMRGFKRAMELRRA